MEALLNKKPNQEILAHQAKRKVEVKVLELREAMEEDGNYDEEEIEVQNTAQTFTKKKTLTHILG